MLTVRIKKRLSHFMLDVTFQMNREIIVLFGPSGSGKTTILNAIAGLTKINDGEISVNDKLLCKAGKSFVPIQKRRIGYLFQDYALFPHKTIWDNIKYGMHQESFARKLVEKFQIEHLLNQYPHEVSGGEKQRTALTRALATEPELLLLDEPFSALDEKTKYNSYQQLLSIHDEWNIPIVLVTHNQREVELLADRILYMQSGKITKEKSNIREKLSLAGNNV